MLTRAKADEQTRLTIPAPKPAQWSKTWTFFENDWHEGNLPIMGARRRGNRVGERGGKREREAGGGRAQAGHLRRAATHLQRSP